MPKFYWKDDAACLDYDTNIFFDKYEEDVVLRPAVDKVCLACPVKRECFAAGIGGKEYGVWGGVFLDEGNISREFNNHKDKKNWGELWTQLTTN